jgi:hypothetical protein
MLRAEGRRRSRRSRGASRAALDTASYGVDSAEAVAVRAAASATADRMEYTRAIREDPEKPGLLYVGTERGVWVSFDDGGRWQRLQLNLPPVPVHDLAVAEGDLIAATHGRSFWVLDDLSPLRQLTPQVVAKPAHLFAPRAAYRVSWGGGRAPAARPVGKNPPSGAVVSYWLAKANQEVTLDFLDAQGKVIRSFTSRQDSASAADSVAKAGKAQARRDSLTKAGVSADSLKKLEAKSEGPGEGSGGGGGEEEEEGPRRAPRPPRVANNAGLNSFTWDLRYPDASSFDDMILWAGGTRGPVAPPGTYAVRLTTSGVTETQRFELRKDPRSEATEGDLREQFAFLMKIRDKVSEANDAVKTIRNVRAQLADRESSLERQGSAGVASLARLKLLGTVLDERLGKVEGEIYQVKNQSSQDPLNYPIKLNNRISALAGVVAGAEARPTDQSYSVFNTLAMKLDVQTITMQSTLKDLLPQVNSVLSRAGLPVITPSTAEIRKAPKPEIAAEEDDSDG